MSEPNSTSPPPATSATSSRPPIALLTSRYPAISETFVWREALAIQALGWPLVGVSMHEPAAETRKLPDLPREDVLLRRNGLSSVLIDAAKELIAHPLRGLGTLARAIADGFAPGESTSLGGRARNGIHAITGLATAHHLRPLGVVHIHCHFAHAPSGVGCYAARQLGISWSFVGHANDLFANRLFLRKKLERAAFVSCISEWHRDWYRQQAPGVTTPMPIIRCGVPYEAIERKVSAAADAGTDPNARPPLRLISVARLVPKKGLDCLIRALGELRRCGAPDDTLAVSLVLAGDGPERAGLEALVDAEGVRDSVTLLGSVAPSSVTGLLAEADAFVLPCRVDQSGDRDGIPVALMEAMAAGIPVVTGDLPTLRELVIPNETGLMCDADDIPALAAIIARLAREPETRQHFGEAGQRHALAEFSMDVNGERLDRALLDVLR